LQNKLLIELDSSANFAQQTLPSSLSTLSINVQSSYNIPQLTVLEKLQCIRTIFWPFVLDALKPKFA